MNKTLNRISSLVPNNPSYKNIASKLNFDGFQIEPITQPKRIKVLKIAIPVTAICLLATVAIVVPLALNNNSQQKEIVFNPSFDEMIASCLSNPVSQSDTEIPSYPIANIGNMYISYKKNPDTMSSRAKNNEIFTLKKESKLHCVYTTKDIYEKVRDAGPIDIDGGIVSTLDNGLSIYANLCRSNQIEYETENKKLKEVIVDDGNAINIFFDDYYLLDIVTYYKDANYENNYFVNFVQYSNDGEHAIIDETTNKSNLKYQIFYLYSNPSKLSDVLNDKRSTYFYKLKLDVYCLKLEKEDDLEVANSVMYYDHDAEPHYYDEIEKCIIRKTFVRSWLSADEYDVVCDYKKMAQLFGF